MELCVNLMCCGNPASLKCLLKSYLKNQHYYNRKLFKENFLILQPFHRLLQPKRWINKSFHSHKIKISMTLLRMKGNEMLLFFITFRFSFYDICNIHDQKNKRKIIRTYKSVSEQLLLSMNVLVPQGKCRLFTSSSVAQKGWVCGAEHLVPSPHHQHSAVKREGEFRPVLV